MSLVILRGLHRRCYTLEQSFALAKLYSTSPKPDDKPAPKNAAPASSDSTAADTKVADKQSTREKVRTNIQGYVFTRYINYLQNYETVLEKRFPTAMKVYRVFMDGVKDFFKDMMALMKIKKIMSTSGSGLEVLTRKELELNYQMPRDMWKVAPVLLLSAVPFGHYVIFPLAYMYPKQMLTSHFWTLQQRKEFAIAFLKDRLEYKRSVFRYLQAKLKQSKNDELHDKWRQILGQLGSGTHPTPQEILAVKDLFTRAPYNKDSLSGAHVKNLCGLNGLHRGPFKRSRLAYRNYVIHMIDRAILREGGVHNMPVDALRNACFMRGLNAANMSTEDLVKWMRDWTHVSVEVNDDCLSLMLHLPILLAYNHPNNWQLIYKER